MSIGRWIDGISDREKFRINGIRVVSSGYLLRQSLYIKGNAVVLHLPSAPSGWLRFYPITVAPSDRAQLFRLSDWRGPEFNVEFDIDVTILGEEP